MTDPEAAWERLKTLCCSDPATAKRCVMVSKRDFLAVLNPPPSNKDS